MTAADRSRRQQAADHAGREARIEAVTRDLVRMDVPQMIARAQYWRGWCIDNEIENTELVRIRYLLDAVTEHLKDERDADIEGET